LNFRDKGKSGQACISRKERKGRQGKNLTKGRHGGGAFAGFASLARENLDFFVTKHFEGKI
jgi:hypothetical protein